MKITRSLLLRILCFALVSVLLCGCAGGGDPAASSKAGVASKAGAASKAATASKTGAVTSDATTSGDASSGESAGTSSAVAVSSQLTSSQASTRDTRVENVTGGTLVSYPEYDKRIERDYAYDVTVTQGKTTKTLTCYNHCDTVASSGRTVNGDAVRRFCEFAFDKGPVRVDITVKTDFSSYTVMPTGKGFESVLRGNVISVYLDKPDYFLLKLDDKDDSILSVLADEPEVNPPKKGDANVTYIDGWYEPAKTNNVRVLTISKDNSTLYLAPGSVLNARVKITGKNVTVKGRGMVLDPCANLYGEDASAYGDADNNAKRVFTIKGDGCKLYDIKLIDARDFNLVVSASDCVIKNYKCLSSEMCTDGITQSSGNNNKYEHCFIYNADNAIVITSGQNQYYHDFTIGTICCAIFPQNEFGTGTFNDFYIFRCDEGLMRNIYNAGTNNTPRKFSLTCNNISAVDVDHFPFIFVGGNMGKLEKKIIFNNLAVPKATGSDQLGATSGSTIQFRNDDGYLATDNYGLYFNGLSIDGKAVTSASELKVLNKAANTTISVTGSGSSLPTTSARLSATCVAPGKIFIGNRQLLLKDPAVEKSGTWYVPASSVCAALACTKPATTKINGVEYAAITAFSGAKYDAATQSVRIPAPTKSDNLLNWFNTPTHSHWGEATCYNTHLVYSKSGSDEIFYNKNTSANCGAYYMLTQQVLQYGAGTYTLTVDVKADTACDANILLSVNRSTTNNYKTVPLTTSWKSITITFKVTNGTPRNAYLAILAKTANTGVSFRNPVLIYTK